MVHADAFEHQMLALINAERAAVGAAPLALEMNLNMSAEDHSDWMLRTDVFSHTGSWGSDIEDRMRDADYDLVPGWGIAENIAVQSLRGPAGITDDVIDLHNSLMDSDGHRANILNPAYTHIGIGIETGDFDFSSGTYASAIVTQNFGYTAGTPDLDSATPPGPSSYEVIRGTSGDNDLFGGAGIDRIIARNGADLVDGGTGDDRLFGQSGNDVLLGRRGDDKLFGGAAADTLDGGTGNDILFGEGGPDTFVYRPGYQDDRIRDFDTNHDKMDLTAFDFVDVAEAMTYASVENGNVGFHFGQGDRFFLANTDINEVADTLLI